MPPKYRDEAVAVRVYTVCDESRYMIVRNIPSLGCGDDLLKLFASYGDVEECKPMAGEECEQFTDVYLIKFRHANNARFAKKKLDGHVFFGNRLQVSYASQFESLSDTKDKLEGRRREVMARLNPQRFKESRKHSLSGEPSLSETQLQINYISPTINHCQKDHKVLQQNSYIQESSSNAIATSDKPYFPLQSMNQTVQLVREKLDKIQSSAVNLQAGVSKKPRVDNRRRI